MIAAGPGTEAQGSEARTGPDLNFRVTLGLDEHLVNMHTSAFTLADRANRSTAQRNSGLCVEDLNALHSVQLSAQQIDATPECAICSEAFERDEEATVLPCGHLYHALCARGWLVMHATCPICRACVDPARVAGDKRAAYGHASPDAVHDCTVSAVGAPAETPQPTSRLCWSDGSRIIHQMVARYNLREER
jgi:hypothetical protein